MKALHIKELQKSVISMRRNSTSDMPMDFLTKPVPNFVFL